MTLKSNAFSLLLSLMAFQLTAQQLTFDSPRELFLHPRTAAGFNYPFLPFDYNSDTLVDFIGATFDDQLLYKGLPDSTYEILDIYQGFTEVPLKVMDFDMDGDDDIIMSRYINLYAEQDSFIFLNPEINFQEDIVDVADFDDNGYNDLLTVKSETFANGTIIIHFQEEDGSFTEVPLHNEYDYSAVDVGDIDNDGDLDFIVMLRFENAPAVRFINDGARNFTATDLPTPYDQFFFPVDLSGKSVELADLDDDGDLDLLTHDGFDKMYIFENVDTFNTLDNVFEEFAFDIQFFRLADMNNDGNLDILAVTNQDNNFQVKYALNREGFDFGSLREIHSFPAPSTFGLPNPNYMKNNLLDFDFDRDGKLDIILTDGFSAQSKVLLLRNTSEITTGLPDRKIELQSLSVYPNPAAQDLRISADELLPFGKLNYTIFSADGKIVQENTFNGDAIDISSLPVGTYRFFLHESGPISSRVYYAHFVKAGQE